MLRILTNLLPVSQLKAITTANKTKNNQQQYFYGKKYLKLVEKKIDLGMIPIWLNTILQTDPNYLNSDLQNRLNEWKM